MNELNPRTSGFQLASNSLYPKSNFIYIFDIFVQNFSQIHPIVMKIDMQTQVIVMFLLELLNF